MDDDHIKKMLAIAGASFVGRAKYSFYNSLQSLSLGHEISSIDPAMATFRYLHAEEEAIVCLIENLKTAKYANSKLLNIKDHTIKARVLMAFKLGHSLVEEFPLSFAFDLKKDRVCGKFGEENPLYTDDPLNFLISSTSEGLNSESVEKAFLDKLVSQISNKTVLKTAQKIADRRNQLLYSSNNGYPALECVDRDFIARTEANTLALIGISTAISKAQKPSPLVEWTIYCALKDAKLFEGEFLRKPVVPLNEFTPIAATTQKV